MASDVSLPLASAAATPRPAIAGTFSVPARRLRSCFPPVRIALTRVPRLIQSAPAPFGPLNLCAESDNRSAPSARTSTGDLAPPTGRRRYGTARPARARSARARQSAGSCRSHCWRASPRRAPSCPSAPPRAPRATTMPVVSTGRRVVVHPRRASALNVVRTASCSIALAIRCRRPDDSSASATPRRAKLSDSVPPLVKTTSETSALNQVGDGRAGLVQNPLRALTELMDARRVAEVAVRGPQHADHRLDDGWVERGGRVVVEIDAHR